MAIVNEQVILEINVEKTIEQLTTYQRTLEALKKSREELTEAVKAGGAEEEKNRQALENTNIAIKQATQEYKTQQGIYQSYLEQKKRGAEIDNFANNSIKANRELLKQLTAQYIELKNPSKQATDTINNLTKTLKQQEAAIGDTRRNVGNYKNDILEAISSIGGFGPKLTGIIKPLGEANLGFKAAGGGLAGLATGALPLVGVAFSAVTSILSKYESVAETVEDATTAMDTGFRALLDGRSISDTVAVALELVETLRDLEDTQAAFNLQTTEFNNEIGRLLLSAKDRTKSEEERLEILQKASRLEKSLFEEERDRVQLEIDARTKNLQSLTAFSDKEIFLGLNGTAAQQKEFIDRLESRALYNKEDLKKLQELILEREKLEGKSLELRERIKNRENLLLQEIDDERKKAQEKQAEEQKKFLEKQAAEREKYLKNLDALESEFLLNDRQRLEKSFNDKIATIKGLSQREVELRFVIEQDKQAALDKFDADLEEKRQQRLADRLKKDLADQQAAFKIIDDNAKKQLELQRLFNQEQEEIDNEYYESSFKTFSEYYDAKKQKYKEDTDAKAKEADTQKKIEQAQYFAARSFASLLSAVSKQAGEDTAAGLAFQKAAAVTQIAIDTASSIASAIAGATEAATAGGPAAPFLLAGYIASMIGAVITAVSQASDIINGADVPTFAEGGLGAGDGFIGVVGGKPHSEGGTRYRGDDGRVVEFEKGEGLYVMKKTAQDEINRLGGWNELFGGRSWGASPVTHAAAGGQISDGGFIIREASKQIDTNITLSNAMKAAFSTLPRPVVSVEEIDNVRDSRDRSVAVSEL